MILFNFLPEPLLLALISSQGAEVESAVAEGRGKVGGFAADCNATLAVEEALLKLKLKLSELKHLLYTPCSFGGTQSHRSNQMASVSNNASMHCTIYLINFMIQRTHIHYIKIAFKHSMW